MKAETGDGAVDHGTPQVGGTTTSQEEVRKDPRLEPSERTQPYIPFDFRLLPPEL